jgi:hypothetical protein
MIRVLGRNIYIVDLAQVVQAAGGPVAFAAKCRNCKFRAVWARLGHAQDLDDNFNPAKNLALAQTKAALASAGIALWGWHVPQCPDKDSAKKEAALVVKWAGDNGLAGILLDAEQNDTIQHDPCQRYFRGRADEAEAYASAIQQACSTAGWGLAFSGNDIPQVHAGFPFDVFLKYAEGNCPQVYYTTDYLPAKRFKDSVDGYKPLEKAQDFQDRYKPVGNITTRSNIPLPDAQTCIAYFDTFLALVNAGGYKAYSLWCWDDAPPEIFDHLSKTPEF